MIVETVSVRDARAMPADRLWIQGVYREYLDDLNPGTGLFPKLREVGHREPDLIAHWFGDPNTFPLVIQKGSEPVGFARVLRIAADRKSTRLNSSHSQISYAVFCLKKKKLASPRRVQCPDHSPSRAS